MLRGGSGVTLGGELHTDPTLKIAIRAGRKAKQKRDRVIPPI